MLSKFVDELSENDELKGDELSGSGCIKPLLDCLLFQSMEAIPIEELKSEKTPRISAEDLIELCELAGPSVTRSPSKKTVKSKPKILIIDVRSPEEYPLLLFSD